MFRSAVIRGSWNIDCRCFSVRFGMQGVPDPSDSVRLYVGRCSQALAAQMRGISSMQKMRTIYN